MKYYQCKHFDIRELVSKRMYEKYKNKPWVLWQLFDIRLLKGIDALREVYGPMTINDWMFGGKLQYCGFRERECDEGGDASQHRFGRAADLHPQKVSVDEIRKDLINGTFTHPDLKYFTEVEDKVSWLHTGTRNVIGDIFVFNP